MRLSVFGLALAGLLLMAPGLRAQPAPTASRPAEPPLNLPETRWTRVFAFEVLTMYVDLEGMRTEGGHRVVWERTVLTEPVEETGVDRIYSLARYDCAGARRATVYIVRMAAGRIVTEEAGPGELRPIGPAGAHLKNAVCGRE